MMRTLHLVTWWKRLGISAIKTGQDAPSWIWCTERLSFFGGGHIVLQRSCMSDVIFNPSLLNWSSLILTVAHIYITYIIYTSYIQKEGCHSHQKSFRSTSPKDVRHSSRLLHRQPWDLDICYMYLTPPARYQISAPMVCFWWWRAQISHPWRMQVYRDQKIVMYYVY